MENIVRNLVALCGISEKLPQQILNFKQFNLNEFLSLPPEKPDINNIIKIMSEIEILNKKVISSPFAHSLGGQILTGKCLVVEGEIKQKVEYTANNLSQKVYGLSYEIPFSNFIILPRDFNLETSYGIEGYLEDISVSVVNNRTIFESITLLLNVTF